MTENIEPEFPLFTTTGKVGYFHRPDRKYDIVELLEEAADATRGTDVDIARNRLYQAVKSNQSLQQILGFVFSQMGSIPACSFGEQALVIQVEKHKHLLRITTADQVNPYVLENYISGVIDTFSVVLKDTANDSTHLRDSIVLSVTPYVNINDVRNEHVLALTNRYPPSTGSWVFTDAKPENVGLFQDGTAVIIDLGAFTKTPSGERGEMLIASLEPKLELMRQQLTEGIIIPQPKWEMDDGTPKQHHFYGDPRKSNMAQKIRDAVQILEANNRISLKFMSRVAYEQQQDGRPRI